MPVQIGATTHTFADPTGLLSDCHRRVEMFLGSLQEVAKRIDQPASNETRQALTGALRYFAQAAPKHTADEEESLFPRLRQIDAPAMRSSLAHLEKLEDDHRWAAPLHAAVERLGNKYLATEKLTDSEITEFRNAVDRLALMYRQHIGTEDEFIFPIAKRLLSAAEKAAIAQEMADRRNVS